MFHGVKPREAHPIDAGLVPVSFDGVKGVANRFRSKKLSLYIQIVMVN
jgi:hypothetical protein